MDTHRLEQAADLLNNSQYQEAEHLLLDLRDASPKDPQVNRLLGILYSQINNLVAAEHHFKVAVKSAPKNEELFVRLTDVYNNLDDHKAALEAARRAVSINKRSEPAHINLGHSYYFLRKPVMARQAYSKATELAPQSVAGHLCLYKLDTSVGEMKKAEEHLAKAYEIAPDSEFVLLEAAEHPTFRNKPPIRSAVLKHIENPDPAFSNETIARLNQAAGKISEAEGDLGSAYGFYDRYKSVMYRPYNLQLRQWHLETCKSVFTREFFDNRQDIGLASERPVFVVGMPRSGTTLVEQIIGRHPKAVGVGELNYFIKQQEEMSGAEIATPAMFEKALGTDKKHYKRIGSRYLSELDSYDKKARRVVDKMPHNFEMLWLIALLFPNAKIIHVHRQPADTCTSIYSTALRARHSYNRDQETLGTYYSLYADLMDHWETVLPVSIHHQSYEDLVYNQEAESRKLLDHAGLDWDPICLESHAGDQQVLTMSNQQVRQPVYQSSIGRWKKHEEHIQPLLKSLGKHAPENYNKAA